MSFRYSSTNREEYERDGLTVLRDLIPPALLTDLRRQAERARTLAYTLHGPQAQRLQPVYRYPELDHRPFRDFLALPELRATVSGILGDDHTESDILGILFEPQENAWATPWHRDWGYNVPHIDIDAFFDAARNRPKMFNQLNGALYDDHSLWVVPGSDRRRDTDAETAHFEGKIPPPGPALTDAMTAAERERICLRYTRAMPGATPVPLGAGDVAFYRAVGWHLGTYHPHARRATLHDGFYGPDDRAWQADVPRIAR
jgi:hypothetical protein